MWPSLSPFGLQFKRFRFNSKSCLLRLPKLDGLEMLELELEQMRLQKESAKTDSEVLVNYAQAGKLVKDTEMAETKEKLDVLDNMIDAESRQNEMQDRKEDRKFKAAVELAKLENQQVKGIKPETIDNNINQNNE